MPPPYQRNPAGPPMSFGNMRQNGVRRLSAWCFECSRSGIIEVDDQPDETFILDFEKRVVCGKCRRRNISVRPNWAEQTLPSTDDVYEREAKQRLEKLANRAARPRA